MGFLLCFQLQNLKLFVIRPKNISEVLFPVGKFMFILNPLLPGVLFLYPLKTTKKIVSDMRMYL